MKVSILNTENRSKINSSILKEMGLPTNLNSVLLFSCFCPIDGEKFRCIKGAIETTEIQNNKIAESNAEMQLLRNSLHTKLAFKLRPNSKNYNEIVEALFEYMNCENAIYDVIQKNPSTSFGCTLSITPTDESSNKLVVSNPEFWDKATKTIEREYSVNLKKVL